MTNAVRVGLLFVFGVSSTTSYAQQQAKPVRTWSIGPLVTSDPVMGFAVGAGGAMLTGSHVDSQTQSIFAATRSMAFTDDRIVTVVRTGMRRVEGTQAPESVYQLLSIETKTGAVKNRREISGFGSVEVFATSDNHVIVSGREVLRLTADLSDDGSFNYEVTGHKFGRIQNISPDGSTLGNATSPGFELVDSRTLERRQLTAAPSVDTSVNSKGFVTDNVHWIRDYPKDLSFITYTDTSGDHLLYHGKCGGRPQFLTDTLLYEPGCKNPLIIDTSGNVVKTLKLSGAASFAGASRNGKRFALQSGDFTGTHTLKSERFAIYSIESGALVAEVSQTLQVKSNLGRRSHRMDRSFWLVLP